MSHAEEAEEEEDDLILIMGSSKEEAASQPTEGHQTSPKIYLETCPELPCLPRGQPLFQGSLTHSDDSPEAPLLETLFESPNLNNEERPKRKHLGAEHENAYNTNRHTEDRGVGLE